MAALFFLLIGIILMAYRVDFGFVVIYPYQVYGLIFLVIFFFTSVTGFMWSRNAPLDNPEMTVEFRGSPIPLERRIVNCKYMNNNRFCQAIKENQEGEVVRNQSCTNKTKSICCYLCEDQISCPISCDFLGNPEKVVRSKDYTYEDINKEISECENKIQQLASLYAEGKIGEQSYAISSKTLEKKIAELTKRKNKANQKKNSSK